MSIQNNVLITATIEPNTNVMVAVSDVEERLETYKTMLKYWLEETDANEIIFCENSNYQWDQSEIRTLALARNKKLEILSFTSSDGAVEKGKGFAEGEIFKYAFENSSLIKNWSHFYKASGRIKILNIDSIFRNSASSDCLGILAAPYSQTMDTRFFKFSLDYFRSTLLEYYSEVNDSAGIYLEHVYYNRVTEAGGVRKFGTYPNIVGISGSTGSTYNKSKLGLLLRQLALQLGFYSLPFKSR